MIHDQEMPALFQHTKRDEWGLAIIAWEGRDKRRYQFQDGTLRTFKKGFYNLLEPVDKPMDIAVEIVEELESKLDVSRARRTLKKEAKASGKRLVTFDDQVRVFTHLYPECFADPTYITDVRGTDAPRRRKRHRDAAVAHAAEELSRERLEALASSGDWAAIHKSACDVANGTNIAGRKTDLEPLLTMDEAQHEAFGKALIDVLWGEGDYASRFKSWLEVLRSGSDSDRSVTWPLATLLPALVHPEDHVAVKPSVFREQAKWMAPRLDFDLVPSASLYGRFQQMAFAVRRRLEQAGLSPVDLLDVYDFVWETLRPKGKKLVAKLIAQAR